jgi:hypothetical protein
LAVNLDLGEFGDAEVVVVKSLCVVVDVIDEEATTIDHHRVSDLEQTKVSKI